MNFKNKWVIFLFIIFTVIFGYFHIIKNISNSNSIVYDLKLILPENFKTFLKKTLFIHHNQKILEKKISSFHENRVSNLAKIFNHNIVNENILKSFEIQKNFDFLNLREEMINELILNKNQIIFKDNEKISIIQDTWKFKPIDYQIYSAKYYDIIHYGILEKSKNSTDKLVIFNGGHYENPYNSDYFIQLKNELKDKGYDLLSLSMTGNGYNRTTKIDFPNYVEKSNPFFHKSYSSFYDENFPNKKPLSIMLSGNYYLIKNMIKNNDYKEIHMIGLSGGGWYTTILSGLITEIKNSYSVAGPLPVIFMVFNKLRPGWEEFESSLSQSIDYHYLYRLATLDEKGKPTRKHYQIFNDQDPCCSRNPEASILKNIFEKINIENFKIVIFNNSFHNIELNQFFKLFYNR